MPLEFKLKILYMGPQGYYFQDGWPGGIGFPLPGAARGCGCNSFPPPFPPQRDCDRDRGGFGPIDSSNVIYHLFQQSLSNLINMELPNGTSAQIIFETIDGYIGPLKVGNWFISNIRTLFPAVNFQNVQQFGQAVDAELGTLIGNINTISGSSMVPLTSTNTESITFNLTGTLNRNISASVNISTSSGNTLILNPDGLFAIPQQLSINYLTNQIGITGGNTVNLPNAPSGWLGNLSSDPSSAVDGNYWYNTSSSQLKFKANGIIIVP
jgi:hypothetical protein